MEKTTQTTTVPIVQPTATKLNEFPKAIILMVLIDVLRS